MEGAQRGCAPGQPSTRLRLTGRRGPARARNAEARIGNRSVIAVVERAMRTSTVGRIRVLVRVRVRVLVLVLGLALVACGADDVPVTTGSGGTTVPGSGAPETTVLDGREPSVVTTGTSQPPLVRSVAQAQLTEPWSCGWGFSATDPAHTVALLLRADMAPPAGSSTVTLPAAGWEGEVQLGTDLLTVECTDLDIRRSPAPDEMWPVVGGTLQITVPPLDGCGAGSPPATAIATDVTVEAPDGTTVTFAELSLVNDQWGCFAG